MSSKWTPLNTAADLVAEYKPLIKGKTILTTGVTPGSIGAAFVEALAAASPSLLILAGRSSANLEKEAANVAQAAADASAGPVQTRNVVVDLLSLSSVRKAADEVNSWDDVPQIDVVVNCAGIMGTPFKRTEDGYESQFAANHLSHFLLTNLLMDKILAAPAPRVINVASNGHRVHPIRLDDVNFGDGKEYNKWFAYGQSKTANMLFSLQLSRALASRGLLALSLHPGLIMSSGLAKDLDFSGKAGDDFSTLLAADRAMGNALGYAENFAKIPNLTPAQGAATNVFAAFEPTLKDHNGAYLEESRLSDPFQDVYRSWARDPIEAEQLWKLSEKMVGQEFSY